MRHPKLSIEDDYFHKTLVLQYHGTYSKIGKRSTISQNGKIRYLEPTDLPYIQIKNFSQEPNCYQITWMYEGEDTMYATRIENTIWKKLRRNQQLKKLGL